MILGALIDAGVPLDEVRRALGSLAIGADDGLDGARDARRYRGDEVLRARRGRSRWITRTTTNREKSNGDNKDHGHTPPPHPRARGKDSTTFTDPWPTSIV